MKKFLVFCLLSVIAVNLFAQVIPANRTVNWSNAGFIGDIPTYSKIVDVTEYGLKGDGITSNNTPFLSALNSLNGKPGVLYFPAGNYLFDSSIDLPDSIIIRGESSATLLRFNQNGSPANSINIHGTISDKVIVIAQDVLLNDTEVNVKDARDISAGDYVKIYQNDSSLIVSSWAVHSVAQVVKIKEILGNKLILQSPVRRDYYLSDYPRLVKIEPRRGVGLECFSMERVDATTDQTTNFDFDKAVNCWMIGVNSNMCNFAHVALSTSSNILVRGNYFHHGFSYGGGGKAYGTCLQFSSGECLIENNIFNNLRHSMLFQTGANGNVCAYNYSINPNRTEFPSNAGGDIVLHGDYPFANLFEGNICQTVSIDDSHGSNGPYNTFFRNNIQLYGILISSASSGNNQNFAGNEIVNTGAFMGNYNLSGSGHFEYGNNQKGTIKPTGTNLLNDKSYYLTSRPSYFTLNDTWPSIGTPYIYNTPVEPSALRYNSSNYTDCRTEIMTSIISDEVKESISIYPNPTDGFVTIGKIESFPLVTCEVYNTYGKLIGRELIADNQIDFNRYPGGVYFIKVGGECFKLIKK